MGDHQDDQLAEFEARVRTLEGRVRPERGPKITRLLAATAFGAVAWAGVRAYQRAHQPLRGESLSALDLPATDEGCAAGLGRETPPGMDAPLVEASARLAYAPQPRARGRVLTGSAWLTLLILALTIVGVALVVAPP